MYCHKWNVIHHVVSWSDITQSTWSVQDYTWQNWNVSFFFVCCFCFYTVDSLPRNLLLIVWDNQYWALIFSYRAPVLMTAAKVTPFVSFLRLKYSWDAKLCFFASKLIHFRWKENVIVFLCCYWRRIITLFTCALFLPPNSQHQKTDIS